MVATFLIGIILFSSPLVSKTRGSDSVAYHLDRAPFITPRIIQDLTSWISDEGDQVVAVNLSESQLSNRYFGTILTRDSKNSYPWVYWIDDSKHYTNPVEFGYRYVGKSANGISVINTYDAGGGSETDFNLLFLRFKQDEGYVIDPKTGWIKPHSRCLLEKVAQVYLGSNWYGTFKIKGNQFIIYQTQSGPLGEPNGAQKTIIDLSKFYSQK